MRRQKVTKQQIIVAIKQSKTMTEAANKVGLHLSSLKQRALALGLYTPNQGRRGIKRTHSYVEIPLEEILENKHPQYTSTKLKNRLFKTGLKQKQCESCGEDDQSLSFELDHIDGDNSNHKLSNLRILCPNCHSKTPTFRGRNIRKVKKHTKDKQFLDLIIKGHDTKTILKKLNLVAKGANYRRVDRLKNIVDYILSKTTPA